MELYLSHIPEQFKIIIASLLATLGFGIVAWIYGFFHIPHENKIFDNYQLKFFDVLGAFLVFILVELFFVPSSVYFLFSYVAGHFISTDQFLIDSDTRGWLNIYAIFASLFFLMLYFFRRSYLTRMTVLGVNGFQYGNSVYECLAKGSLTWFLSYPLVLAIGQTVSSIVFYFFQTPRNDQVAVSNLKMTYSNPIQFYLLVVSICVLVPILEEFLFRGFLQTYLKQKMGSLWAIITTSAIFATFHFSNSQGLDNIELLVSLFTLSCFLGYLYERERSIWASVGLHVTFNCISIIMLLSQEN